MKYLQLGSAFVRKGLQKEPRRRRSLRTSQRPRIKTIRRQIRKCLDKRGEFSQESVVLESADKSVWQRMCHVRPDVGRN
jgi:hypothetical protein